MELIWTPSKDYTDNGGITQRLEAGPFAIDTSMTLAESWSGGFYACFLHGPGGLLLTCASVSDAMDTAVAIADDMEEEAPRNRRQRREKTGLPDHIRTGQKNGGKE